MNIILIIVGVIAYIFIKQVNKSSSSQETVQNYEPNEIEINEEDYEFESTSPFAPTPPPTVAFSEQQTNKRTSPFAQNKKKRTSIPAPDQQEHPMITNEQETEFNIRSEEEVRRGIIWSEILNRKY